MKTKRHAAMVVLLLPLISLLPSCGGKPAAMGDIPVYPEAVELTAETSAIGGTLGQNEKTDAALRKTMGAGGKLEQRAWQLPAGAAWPAVKAFYEEKLQAAGWKSGLGNIGGGMVDVNKMMETANPLVQTMVFTRGKQSLTLLLSDLPMKREGRQLIISLASN